MSAREERLSCDADHPEPTATLELTTDEARRLLHLLDTAYRLKHYELIDISLASRLMTCVEEMNRGESR